MKEAVKKVVVLGGGESGIGAALLAQAKGYEVFLSDKGALQSSYRQQLQAAGIPFEEGHHSEARILEADLAVKSPGIPGKVPLIQALLARGIMVVSEIEFASWFTDAFLVGITGTNGKTTTTRLTHHLLVTGGKNAALGGNVGKSFAANVLEGESPIHVLELSSFQLDDIRTFRPNIAMLLNITPDHLDRYEYRMDLYAAAKMRLTAYQRPEDLFLFNASDPATIEVVQKMPVPGRTVGLSQDMIENGLLKAGGHTFDLKESSLKGVHNAMNALFAVHCALELGIPPVSIQEGLNTYINAPHRLEWIAEINGVAYYNDSKATNVEAAFFALQAMTRPIVWIVGGQDKGNDYGALMDLVRQKVRGIVCLGVENEKIIRAFEGLSIPMTEVRSADEAALTAKEWANPGDAVLLAPACASFDLFRNYEDRGDQFRAAVLGMK